jgi:hypothetical protein
MFFGLCRTAPHKAAEMRYTTDSYEVGLLSPLLSLVVGSPIVLPKNKTE